MIRAFDGIHGRIAVALAVPGLALAAGVSGPGGAATQHDWRGHPARVAGAAPPGPAARRISRATRVAVSSPARPGAVLTSAVVTTAFSGGKSDEYDPAQRRRVRIGPAERRRIGTARPSRVRVGPAARPPARIGGSPRQVARWLLVHRLHWRRWQFHYLNLLWDRESGWNSRARNPYSGAYGIPQAVPGIKMASAGSNWRSSARTQIRWGMRYILDRYRTPYWAWRHEVNDGWY